VPRSRPTVTTRRSELHAATQVVIPELPAGNANHPHCVARRIAADRPGLKRSRDIPSNTFTVARSSALFAFFRLSFAAVRDPASALWPGPPRESGPMPERC
jgi:hypothetical protein